MDPNAALESARKALAEYREADRNGRDTVLYAEDLADSFEALDEWLSKGGFTPKAWVRVGSPEWDAHRQVEEPFGFR